MSTSNRIQSLLTPFHRRDKKRSNRQNPATAQPQAVWVPVSGRVASISVQQQHVVLNILQPNPSPAGMNRQQLVSFENASAGLDPSAVASSANVTNYLWEGWYHSGNPHYTTQVRIYRDPQAPASRPSSSHSNASRRSTSGQTTFSTASTAVHNPNYGIFPNA